MEHQYLDRDDWVRPAQIVDELEAAVRDVDPTMVVAPFGLANPDHDCTHEAGESAGGLGGLDRGLTLAAAASHPTGVSDGGG